MFILYSLYHLIRVIQVRYNRYINNRAASSMSFFSQGDDEDDDDDDETDDEASEATTIPSENEQRLSESSDVSSLDKNNNSSSNSKRRHLHHREAKSEPFRTSSLHRRHASSKREDRISDERDESRVNNEYFLLTQEGAASVKVEDEIYLNTNTGNICSNCLKKYNPNPYSPSNEPVTTHADTVELPTSEKRKTLISFLYLFVCSLWCTFMLTVVHDRVPDIDRYPPFA